MNSLDNKKTLAIIGLGYVGLPLAVEFGKKFNVIAYDINEGRVLELKDGIDHTLEVSKEDISSSHFLTFTSDQNELHKASIFIVTVPTPIDKNKRPDLSPLVSASKMLGGVIKRGDTVIYESTVYPGATEEVCIPIIEKYSGFKYNLDFFAGYSPERINPGDKTHRLTNIRKVTSGSTPEIANEIDMLYASIITAGTYKAESIRVAEAAKVIENTQRDLNIALINELAIIFNKLSIDTEEVLKAAGTKWNFLPFRPGLVGGHCIGVDPYYLTHKAEEIGYHPEVILSGRRINDSMASYIASQLIKKMIKNKISLKGANVLLLGLSFKENCPDIRNTKIVDVIEDLEGYGLGVDVYDPWVSKAEALSEYGLSLIDSPRSNYYDAIIIAVAHREFSEMGHDGVRSFGTDNHIIYDLKYVLNASESDIRL